MSRIVVCVAVCLMSIWTVFAQTSAFTYQGKLNDGANPANGTYDIQFKLFDTPTVGTGVQQGPTITNGSVAMNAGVFAVQLDFGLPAFSGPPRYLELAIRPAGSPNAYTILGPRSPVSSTPYSLRSLNASVADTLSSACVGCVSGTQIGSLPSTATASIFAAATQFNIGADRILASGPTSIFVGRLAGASNTVGTGNTFVGESSGRSNTSGSNNSFFGRDAGSLNTASDNSFFGAFSGLSNTTATRNSFFGSQSGVANTWGDTNSFFGASAGRFNTVGSQNAFFGNSAGEANTSGSWNTFIGEGAGKNNTSGQQNTFVGLHAGYDNVTGLLNVFVGYASGVHNTSGQKNSFVGLVSGSMNSSGQQNSFFGFGAGTTNTTGDSNTIIGSLADVATASLSYATAIGAESIASQSNSIFLGRPDGSDVVRIPGAAVINGTLVVGTLGSAGSTSVCLNAVNRFAPCSSSLRYKTSVQTFSRGLDVVRRLRPITFDWKDSGAHDVGFGAEEVNDVEPLLTTLNSSGEIEGVKYAQITTVLVNAVKEQQTIIEQQQNQINELRKLACRSHPRAALCK